MATKRIQVDFESDLYLRFKKKVYKHQDLTMTDVIKDFIEGYVGGTISVSRTRYGNIQIK